MFAHSGTELGPENYHDDDPHFHMVIISLTYHRLIFILLTSVAPLLKRIRNLINHSSGC